MEDKTGITDFDASLVSDFVYVEEYDIFFSQVSDCYMKDVRCEAGVRNGDVLQLIFHVGFQTNNRRLTIEATGDSEDINIEQYSDVVEVEFWDVDDDGVADMIVILSDGDDSVAVLCKGYVNQWSEGYTSPKEAVTKWLSENVGDMTADGAISYILDHKDEFNDL